MSKSLIRHIFFLVSVILLSLLFALCVGAVNNDVVGEKLIIVYDPPTYTGEPIQLEPTVIYDNEILKLEEDYTLKYNNNTKAGYKAEIQIIGKNSYSGINETKTFTILEADISDAVFTKLNNVTTYGYMGYADITITYNNIELKVREDYYIEYFNYSEEGLIKARLIGCGNFYGHKDFEFYATKGNVNDLDPKFHVSTSIDVDSIEKGETYWGRCQADDGTLISFDSENDFDKISASRGHSLISTSYDMLILDGAGKIHIECTTKIETKICGYEYNDRNVVVMVCRTSTTKDTKDFDFIIVGNGIRQPTRLNANFGVPSSADVIYLYMNNNENEDLTVDEWKSSDETIANVSNGKVILKKPGNVTITAKVNDLEAKWNLDIEAINLESNSQVISYNKKNDDVILLNKNYRLTKDKDYKVKSSVDGDVVTVEISGCNLFSGTIVKKFWLKNGNPVYCEHDYLETVILEPGCRTNGTKLLKCSICGYDKNQVINALGHNYSSEWTIDVEPTCAKCGYKSNHCIRCDDKINETKIPATGHKYDYEWVEKEATCMETGVVWKVCKCGDDVKKTLPKTDCVSDTGVVLQEGSCTENRVVVYSCVNCKTVLKYEENDSQGHKYSDQWIVDVAPGCTTSGYKSYHCRVCGNKKDVTTINPVGHKYTNWISDMNAGCTTDGTKTRICESCSFKETTEDIGSMTGHMFDEYIFDKNATCTENGTKTAVCKSCGLTDTKEAENSKINHSNVIVYDRQEPTCTNNGYTIGKYCPACNLWLENREILPIKGHDYHYTTTQEATCWREGVKTYTCSCGDTYTEAIAKLEHEYRPWETKKKPTCTEPGLEWSYCLICDNDFEREIPAEGHNEYAYTRRATPSEAGAYVVACDKCWIEFSSVSFGRPAEYKLSTTTYTYNGKAKTPKLTVTTSDGKVLKKGVDYTVELPKDRTSVGTHTYRVAFMGDYLGETKVSYQILPGKTSSVSASQSTDYIKLSWKKVSGATGYRVYQYNSSTGKYKTLKTLTGTSYTIKELKSGTSYKFAVKAYTKVSGKTYWASSSKTITTATKPAKATLSSVKLSGSKAVVSWKNISGESGYQIYYATAKDGTYKKMASVKANKTSYTSDALKSGKTYYFKVRAYKKVGDSYLYGGFSSIKSVTVKNSGSSSSSSGSTSARNKEVAAALKKCERYVTYLELEGKLLDNAIDMYRLTGKTSDFIKIQDRIYNIDSYYAKIRGYCKPYKELEMLYNDCDVDIPYYSTSTLAYAATYGTKATRLGPTYNYLCNKYGA